MPKGSKIVISEQLKARARNANQPKPKKKAASAQKSKPLVKMGTDQLLKSLNSYYRTLEDPFHITGEKIPDLDTSQSAAFFLRQKFTLQTNSSGNAFLMVGKTPDSFSWSASLVPHPTYGSGAKPNNNNLTPVNVGAPSPAYYYHAIAYTTNSVTVNQLNAGTETLIEWSNWSYSNPAVPSRYTHCRLVSYGLSCQALAATNNSSGKISACFLPKDKIDPVYATYGNTYVTLPMIEEQLEAIIVPLNEFKPFTMRYKPLDNSCLEYTNNYNVVPGGTDASKILGGGANVGTFLVAVTGAAANTAIQVVLHGNYEGVYTNSSFGLSGTTQAHVDVLALNHAFQEIATTPSGTTAKSVQYEQSKSGPIVPLTLPSPAKKKSILTQIIDGLPAMLEKGGKFAMQLAPLMAML